MPAPVRGAVLAAGALALAGVGAVIGASSASADDKVPDADGGSSLQAVTAGPESGHQQAVNQAPASQGTSGPTSTAVSAPVVPDVSAPAETTVGQWYQAATGAPSASVADDVPASPATAPQTTSADTAPVQVAATHGPVLVASVPVPDSTVAPAADADVAPGGDASPSGTDAVADSSASTPAQVVLPQTPSVETNLAALPVTVTSLSSSVSIGAPAVQSVLTQWSQVPSAGGGVTEAPRAPVAPTGPDVGVDGSGVEASDLGVLSGAVFSLGRGWLQGAGSLPVAAVPGPAVGTATVGGVVAGFPTGTGYEQALAAVGGVGSSGLPVQGQVVQAVQKTVVSMPGTSVAERVVNGEGQVVQAAARETVASTPQTLTAELQQNSQLLSGQGLISPVDNYVSSLFGAPAKNWDGRSLTAWDGTVGTPALPPDTTVTINAEASLAGNTPPAIKVNIINENFNWLEDAYTQNVYHAGDATITVYDKPFLGIEASANGSLGPTSGLQASEKFFVGLKDSKGAIVEAYGMRLQIEGSASLGLGEEGTFKFFARDTKTGSMHVLQFKLSDTSGAGAGVAFDFSIDPDGPAAEVVKSVVDDAAYGFGLANGYRPLPAVNAIRGDIPLEVVDPDVPLPEVSALRGDVGPEFYDLGKGAPSPTGNLVDFKSTIDYSNPFESLGKSGSDSLECKPDDTFWFNSPEPATEAANGAASKVWGYEGSGYLAIAATLAKYFGTDGNLPDQNGDRVALDTIALIAMILSI